MRFLAEAPQTQESGFSVDKEIDGLVYNIKLRQMQDEPYSYELSFIVNDSESLTGKGLSVVNKLADSIYEFIKETLNKERIDKIVIRASSEVGEDERLQGVLLEIYNKDPDKFYGFTYENTEDMHFGTMSLGKVTKSFQIDQNGLVFSQRCHEPSRKTTRPFPKPKVTWYENGTTIQEFLEKPSKIALIRRGNLQEALPFLLKYLGIDFKETTVRSGKDPEKQRANLWERVLLNRFPQRIVSRKGNIIEINTKLFTNNTLV